MFEELVKDLGALFREEGLRHISTEELNPFLYGFLPLFSYHIRIDKEKGCMVVSLRYNPKEFELLHKIEAIIKSYNLCYEVEYLGEIRNFNIYA